MTKPQQGRKAPRRKAQVAPANVDFAELMAVIAENKLANNAAGWFVLPWRDGWNAANLAHADFDERMIAVTSGPVYEAHDAMRTWLLDRVLHANLHARAEELQRDIALEALTIEDGQSRSAVLSLIASLRCVQVLAANSSAGGHAYNAILRRVFEHPSREASIADTGSLIAACRCDDAVGMEQDDLGNERARRAFFTAWEHGLYHAAYAIKGV